MIHDYSDVANIIQAIERKETDVAYLIFYIQMRDYKTDCFPSHLRATISKLIESSFTKVCSAKFHISSSIKVTRDVYTNKWTGNELYVNDHGTWISMTEFLKVFDLLRDMGTSVEQLYPFE